jgi:hypothetical protein
MSKLIRKGDGMLSAFGSEVVVAYLKYPLIPFDGRDVYEHAKRLFDIPDGNTLRLFQQRPEYIPFVRL